MQEILIPIVLIWLLAGLGWRLGTMISIKVCPVCVGTSGTWLILLALYFTGTAIDPIIIAALMGGSVVGLAYQGVQRLANGRSSVLWKLSIIPVGFLLVISVIEKIVALGLISALSAAIITYIFLFAPHKAESLNKENSGIIEKKLNKCC